MHANVQQRSLKNNLIKCVGLSWNVWDLKKFFVKNQLRKWVGKWPFSPSSSFLMELSLFWSRASVPLFLSQKVADSLGTKEEWCWGAWASFHSPDSNSIAFPKYVAIITNSLFAQWCGYTFKHKCRNYEGNPLLLVDSCHYCLLKALWDLGISAP